MDYLYHLAKYAGKSSRLPCPACGRSFCFSPYVDDDGNILNETVGRCDHESSCGYHLTPSQYFLEHPEARPQGDDWRKAPDWLNHSNRQDPQTRHCRPVRESPCTLPEEIVLKTLRTTPKSTLIQFLDTIFVPEVVQRLQALYRLGVTRNQETIFYQIDAQGRYRAGKIMQYNPSTGHRIKDGGIPVDWVHARLKKQGTLPESWTVSQCLFGEHLLPQMPDAIVCLVESEKTAVICTGFCPQYVWLATGGKTQLGTKLSVLKGRKVLVFPDIDAYGAWLEAFAKIPGLSVIFSDILEKNGTPEDRAAQIDIADYLLKNCHFERSRETSSVPPVPLHPGTEQYTNPVAREVAKYLSPEIMPEVAALIDDLDLQIKSITYVKPIDHETDSH